MTLSEFFAITDFLGDDMTDTQAEKLMDQARESMSRADMEEVYDSMSGPMFYHLSQYRAETRDFTC